MIKHSWNYRITLVLDGETSFRITHATRGLTADARVSSGTIRYLIELDVVMHVKLCSG
jgi:hypothetical protein